VNASSPLKDQEEVVSQVIVDSDEVVSSNQVALDVQADNLHDA
jgi:hypothetical protein